MKLNDRLYDILSWLALVALDALGVCYKAIAEIWGLPLGDQIVLTCAAVSTLIGTLIGVAKVTYNKKLQ